MNNTAKRVLALITAAILTVPFPVYSEGEYEEAAASVELDLSSEEILTSTEVLSDGSESELSEFAEEISQENTEDPENIIQPAEEASEEEMEAEVLLTADLTEPEPVSALSEDMICEIRFSDTSSLAAWSVPLDDNIDIDNFNMEIALSDIVQGTGSSGEIQTAEVHSDTLYNMYVDEENDILVFQEIPEIQDPSKKQTVVLGAFDITLINADSMEESHTIEIQFVVREKTVEPTGTPAPTPTPVPLSIIDQNGKTKTIEDYTVITQAHNATSLTAGWYALTQSCTLETGFSIIDQEVNLILCDGATLTIGKINIGNKGNSNGTLHIYQGGSNGTGEIAWNGGGSQSANAKSYLISNNGSMNLYGGKITGAPDNLINNTGTLTIKGGNLSGQAGCLVNNSGTFVIDGGNLTGMQSTEKLVNNTGSFTLKKGSLSGESKYGVDSSDSFTMEGGTISGAQISGVYAENGTVSITGGTIQNNKIGIDNMAAKLTVSGGTIENNEDYGIKQVKDTASCNMSGGTVTSCNTGIYIDGGDFTLSGGNVKSNIDIGIDITGNAGRFTISGTLDLFGNNFGIKLEGNDRKLYFGGAVNLPSGQKIDITTNDLGVFTQGYSKYNNVTNPSDLFTCSDPKRIIAEHLNNGEVEIISDSSVPYLDGDGVFKYIENVNVIGTDVTEHDGWKLDSGWYVVKKDLTFNNYRLNISGDAHLILAKSTTLTLNKGIQLKRGNSLTIYGQEKESGKLICYGDANGSAGIGVRKNEIGSSKDDTVESGTLTVNSGAVESHGSDHGAGIGGGQNRNLGKFVMNGGYVESWGGESGAGIGGGDGGSGQTITINGGRVIAHGGTKGTGIGGGEHYYGGGSSGTITINGGIVTAYGGKYGAGIGSGESGDCKSVTINGGFVDAYGGEKGAGIGGGQHYSGHGGYGGTIKITGGEVLATGGKYAAGIGGGEDGDGGSFTMSGGTVKSAAGEDAQAIGAGQHGKAGSISITGYIRAYYRYNGKNTPVAKSSRVSACQTSYVEIVPCTHPSRSFNSYNAAGHYSTCLYCDLNNGLQNHEFDSDEKCACGYQRCRITVRPGNAPGDVQYEYVSPGDSFVLRDPYERYGYTSLEDQYFSGWRYNGKTYKTGDSITVNEHIEIVAQWGITWAQLREMLLNASDNSAVVLQDNVKGGPDDQPLEVKAKDVMLYLNGYTLDRGMQNAGADDNNSIMIVTGSLTIANGTITGGNTANAAGIQVEGGSLKLSSVTVKDNASANGTGGISVKNGTLEMVGGSQIIKNTGGTSGGVSLYKSKISYTHHLFSYTDGYWITDNQKADIMMDPASLIIFYGAPESTNRVTKVGVFDTGFLKNGEWAFTNQYETDLYNDEYDYQFQSITDGVKIRTEKKNNVSSGKTMRQKIMYLTATITFDANGGTGEMKPVELQSNQQYILPACRFKEPLDKTFDRWEVTGEYSDLTGADKGDTFLVKGDCVVKAIWRDANLHIGREEVTPTPTETPDPTETLEPSVTPEATQTPAPSVTATAAPGYGSGGTYGTGTSGGGYSAGTGTSAANEYDVSQKSAVSTDDNTDTTVYLFMMALSMLSLLLITGRRRNR